MLEIESPYLKIMHNQIRLTDVPFSERGSRLILFGNGTHLSIRLAERWVKLDGKLSSYRKRPPIVEEFYFTDEEGNILPIQLDTYPHKVEVTTPIGVFTIAFQDTEALLIKLPPVRFGLIFRAHFDQAFPDRRGGVLRLTGNIRRNMAYTTNATILKNEIPVAGEQTLIVRLLLDATRGNQALLLNITPRLGFNRWVSDPDMVLETAAKRWHNWFANAPQVNNPDPHYYYAWWILCSGLVSTRFFTTREVLMPSKSYYVGVWQWDNLFHALAYNYVDQHLAEDQLRILIDHQREDGMIPDAIYDEGLVTHLDSPVDADVTKPPLLAWAAWKLYQQNHDREFLDEIYEPLIRWNRWWFEHSDYDNDGLCEYQHPFSSGLDDSPLWDEGTPVRSPDLNTYLFLQQEALAKIASVLGMENDAVLWAKRAETISALMLKKFYDKKAGLFWAIRNNTNIPVRTPINLFPLLTGSYSREINRRLVEHLTNEKEFWSNYPLPMVAMDDPRFDPWQMWRGPTWININYLFIEGLKRCGYTDISNQLRQRTFQLIESQSGIHEYYHPQTGEIPPRAAPTFGWSAALYIDLVIQASRELEGKKEGPG